MIVLDKKLYEKDRIIRLSSTEWNDESNLFLQGFFTELKEVFEDSISNNIRCILLCDCNESIIPPMTVLLKVFRFLVSIKYIIESAVDFSIMYSKDNSYTRWFDILFTMYTPTRPIHTITNKKDLKDFLINNKTQKNVELLI